MSATRTRISVGSEFGNDEFGWLWARMKRLANLLREPEILAGAMDIAEALDRYCSVNQVNQRDVNLGDAKFIKGLQYVEYPLERS